MKKRLFIKTLLSLPLITLFFNFKIKIKTKKTVVKKSKNFYWILSKDDS